MKKNYSLYEGIQNDVRRQLQTLPSPVPGSVPFFNNGSMYGFLLNGTAKRPAIHAVIYHEHSEATFFDVTQPFNGEDEVYMFSFQFSGCGMALFEYEGRWYVTHITTSTGNVDGKRQWSDFVQTPQCRNFFFFLPFRDFSGRRTPAKEWGVIHKRGGRIRCYSILETGGRALRICEFTPLTRHCDNFWNVAKAAECHEVYTDDGSGGCTIL